jgi:NADH:ubiquinone oxidoreductase subunit 4 (subunit M)
MFDRHAVVAGLPGLNGFVGEFLILLGRLRPSSWIPWYAIVGTILILYLYSLELPAYLEGSRTRQQGVADLSPGMVCWFR